MKSQSWSLGRVLFAIAGTVIIATLGLGRRSSRWRLVTGAVGANLALFALAGWCPTSLVLRRLGFRPEAEQDRSR